MALPENIGSLLTESHNEKAPERRLWELSLKFLEGRQWLNYDKRLGEYVTAKVRGDSQTRVTVNLLLNIYRNLLSRLALAYPSVVVLPASPSTEDIVKAKASETALRYYWQRDGIKSVIERALEWMLSCGTAALHTYYDPDADEVRTRAVGPYDIFFEKGVISPDDSQWVALRTFVTKDSLREAFPDKEEEIEASGITLEGESYGSVNSSGTTEPPKGRTELFDIYWRDGRYAMFAGDTVLYEEESSPTKTFPVQILRYTEVPRRLWGVSLLTPLLDLQLLYNKARSQVIHNVELMANPKWLIPKTAGVNQQSMTSRPGEKIFYNPAGGAPTQIPAAPMPAYVMDNIMRIQGEMSDVAGVHSVTLGKRAVGVSSGKGMEFLGQQDSSQLQITQQGVEHGVQRMAKCVLELMKTYYTEPKMMSMLDQYGQVTFQGIQGASLVSNPEVFIEANSLFRQEALDRDAKVVELMQMGLLPPEEAMQELSFRTGNSFVSDKVNAIAHARDMLAAVQQGAKIEIFANDDLDAFKDVFGQFMRTIDFYEMSAEIQNYMRDVLVSIATVGAPSEDYENALVSNKVFPRAVSDIGDRGAVAQSIAAPGSPTTQQQIIQENAAKAQRVGSAAATERALTRGMDAGISRQPGGRGAL